MHGLSDAKLSIPCLSGSMTGIAPAQQYYESDFDWHAHQAVCAPVIAVQQQECPAISAHIKPPALNSSEPWEDFHARSGASFYKERRYILKEFPMLLHSYACLSHKSSDAGKDRPRISASTRDSVSPEQHIEDAGQGAKVESQQHTQQQHQATGLQQSTSGSSLPPTSLVQASELFKLDHCSSLQVPSPNWQCPPLNPAPSTSAAAQQQAPTQHLDCTAPQTRADQSISIDPAPYSHCESQTGDCAGPPELEKPPAPTIHIVELGCGSGASLLPILRANPCCFVTGTDISPTSLQHFHAAAQREGIASERIRTFPANTASSAELPRMITVAADICLIIFTLSALTPSQQTVMLQNAHASLAPGGHLMIRDHGLYDMAQMRMEASQWLGEGQLYARKDGTLAYFFSVEELCAKAVQAGFTMLECKYATVQNLNRKTGAVLKRVFIHGLFARSL